MHGGGGGGAPAPAGAMSGTHGTFMGSVQGSAMGQTGHAGLIMLAPTHVDAGTHATGMRPVQAGHGPISPGYTSHGTSPADSHLNVAVGPPARSAAEAVRSAHARAGKSDPDKPPHNPYVRAFYGETHDRCANQGGCPPAPMPYDFGCPVIPGPRDNTWSSANCVKFRY